MKKNYLKIHSYDVYFFGIVFLVSIFPIFANLIGLDFSLNILSVDNDILVSEQIAKFYYLLFQLSSLILMGIFSLSCIVHYLQHKDLTVILIGISLFCVAIFNIFQFTSLLVIETINVEAIGVEVLNLMPVQLAVSGIIHAITFILTALLGFWLSYVYPHLKPIPRSIHVVVIGGAGGIAFVMAYIASTYINTLDVIPHWIIERSFDVVPLALFTVAAALFWNYYKRFNSRFRLALLISVGLMVVSQIYLAFGSSQMFDNYFIISKIIHMLSLPVLIIGIFMDYRSNHFQSSSEFPSTNNIDINDQLEIGQAKLPISIKLPTAVFLVTELITSVVGIVYPNERKSFVIEKEKKVLANDTKKNELIISNFTNELINNLFFLNKTPPLSAIFQTIQQSDIQQLDVWRSR